jgi:hypothetical protein
MSYDVADLIDPDVIEPQSLELFYNTFCDRPFITGNARNANEVLRERNCAFKVRVLMHEVTST